MFRRKTLWIVIGVIVLIPVGIVAWWLLSPLFISKTVEEEFPYARQAVVPEKMTRPEVEKVLAGMAKVDQEMNETMAEAMVKAVKIKAGSLRDADTFHRGSGQVAIYRLPDGSHVLRLDNLKVTNGPGLHVILSPHPSPGKSAEVKTEGYIDLGRLKGNIGNQNYEIPTDANVAGQRSAVIYCKPFQVVFSVATLEDE